MSVSLFDTIVTRRGVITIFESHAPHSIISSAVKEKRYGRLMGIFLMSSITLMVLPCSKSYCVVFLSVLSPNFADVHLETSIVALARITAFVQKTVVCILSGTQTWHFLFAVNLNDLCQLYFYRLGLEGI